MNVMLARVMAGRNTDTWEAEEAEGGARVLLGPSLHISPVGRRWQLLVTGGPLFHPSDTRRASYALKAALSISLLASR